MVEEDIYAVCRDREPVMLRESASLPCEAHGDGITKMRPRCEALRIPCSRAEPRSFLGGLSLFLLFAPFLGDWQLRGCPLWWIMGGDDGPVYY